MLQGGRHGVPPLLQSQNNHDSFVGLEAALEIVVRSRKPKAVELVKWLTRKGFEKVAEEHRLAIDEKDFEIALLDGDLAGTQDLVSCLLYTSPSPRDATLSRMPSSA